MVGYRWLEVRRCQHGARLAARFIVARLACRERSGLRLC